MHEAISLFGVIVNEDWFRNTSVILFLNKMDLLQKKLPESSLVKYFPDYKGEPTDLASVKEYFLGRFQDLKDFLFSHFTCATDSNNIKVGLPPPYTTHHLTVRLRSASQLARETPSAAYTLPVPLSPRAHLGDTALSCSLSLIASRRRCSRTICRSTTLHKVVAHAALLSGCLAGLLLGQQFALRLNRETLR